jgi:hypothetical protein
MTEQEEKATRQDPVENRWVAEEPEMVSTESAEDQDSK